MDQCEIEAASRIVAAYAQSPGRSIEEIEGCIRSVFQIIRSISELPESTADTASAMDSIHQDYVECLECGHRFKLLSNRHLALHGLKPREYKQKYGIPLGQALSSIKITKKRKRLAKRAGHGRQLAAWRAVNGRSV